MVYLIENGRASVEDLPFLWSGRRESNPRIQLGKLMFCH